MVVVVDASVAVRWTIETPLSAAAERLLRPGHTLIAPDLVIVEATNAFYFHLRERTDRAQRALDGLEFLPRWFAELVPAVTLRHRAMTYAMELDHPVYDCFYLALAASRRAPLVTADDRFLQKVRDRGHEFQVVHVGEW